MSDALTIAATLLGLAGIWAAAPSAPEIVWRQCVAWVRHQRARLRKNRRVHGSLAAATPVTVIGTGSGYMVPADVAEQLRLLLRERGAVRGRLDAIERDLEGLREGNAKSFEGLRDELKRREQTGVRINALALPAVATATILAGVAPLAEAAPWWSWPLLGLGVVVAVPTLAMPMRALREQRSAAQPK
jgi:hypothetical protein